MNFDKGCYLGQETVARIHYRGHVNRHLRCLRLGSPADAGTPLLVGSRRAGYVTSVADSPRFGLVALGFVSRGHDEVGTQLQVEAGGAVEVVEPPVA